MKDDFHGTEEGYTKHRCRCARCTAAFGKAQREFDGQSALNFDGETFVRKFDAERLTGQLKRVYSLMRDGEWRTPDEIGAVTGDRCQSSITARCRDLRKPKFGTHTVDRRRRGDPKAGLFEYRVVA